MVEAAAASRFASACSQKRVEASASRFYPLLYRRYISTAPQEPASIALVRVHESSIGSGRTGFRAARVSCGRRPSDGGGSGHTRRRKDLFGADAVVWTRWIGHWPLQVFRSITT